MLSRQKTYAVDGEAVSPRELIERASDLDPLFRHEPMKFTSAAAMILRNHGHVVEDIRDNDH